ncbi:MAG TPA: CHASE2 domain-containing protein, partial [Vicinamibacteria bacterium]
MSDEGSRLFDEALIARQRLRKWIAVTVGVLAVLRLAAEVLPALRRPDLTLFDAWQSLRATDTPSPQIAIVAIDEKSIARFGPPAWPRTEYVPLVERLAAAGARVIGFDFTFASFEREASNDPLLADAMKKAGNVVFGYEFTDVGDPSPPGTPPSRAVQANAFPRFESPALPPAPSLIEPEPVLAAAAAAMGHVRTVVSVDGRIRVASLAIQHGDKAYPSLALQMARVYTGTPLESTWLGWDAVTMGDVSIPVSASGEMLLDWPAAGAEAFPRFSFLDVVRGDVPDDAFRGKAVLVGGTASGLDERDFPFAAKAPGVLLYATFLDNVFRFDFLRAPTWAWLLEWGLLIAVWGLGVWLLPRLPTPALLAGVPVALVLLLGAAAFLLVQKGVWVKVFYPGLGLLVPMAVMVALRLTASERETRDATAEKIENQKLL